MIGDLAVSIDGDTVDLVAVERAISGRRHRPRLSRAEQEHAVRLLLERGHGTAMIGKKLGVSGATANALVEAVTGR